MTEYGLRYLEQINREIRETPEEYFPALLNIVRSYRQSVALSPADASFQQGWKEVLQGETLPISELWVGIDEPTINGRLWGSQHSVESHPTKIAIS